MQLAFRPAGATLSALAVLLQGLALPVPAQDSGPPLNIAVIPGDRPDKHNPTEEFRVRVDSAGQPVSGALVYFQSPNDGPGGSFLDGMKSMQVMTNADGIAFAPGFKPNGNAGAYDIRLIAMYQGQIGYGVIHDANEPARVAGLSRKAWWIIGGVAVGAAAGGGTYLALHHGASSSSISAGGVSVGAPH